MLYSIYANMRDMYTTRQQKQHGFAVLEVIIVVAVLAVIGGAAFFCYG